MTARNDSEDGAAASSTGREKQVIFATKNVEFCLKKADFDVKNRRNQSFREARKRALFRLLSLLLSVACIDSRVDFHARIYAYFRVFCA